MQFLKGVVSVSDGINKNALTETMLDKLVLLRTNLKLKQGELASKVGISRQTLSGYENKKSPMTWNNFVALLMVFREDKSTNDLLIHFGLFTPELSKYLTSPDNTSGENT
jgi:DNA-binding XRE family transcriptional regulator